MDQRYRFDFVNRDGSIDSFSLGEFGELGAARDDGEATLRARSAMLVSQTAVAVEVWKDGERLCRVRRDANLYRAPARQALSSVRVAAPAPAISAARPADDGFPSGAAAASA